MPSDEIKEFVEWITDHYDVCLISNPRVIAEILGTNKEWSGDELDAIADVVRESGRTYRGQK